MGPTDNPLDGLEGMPAGSPTLISVMVANNETGVVRDIAALAAEAQSTSAWFHTDGVRHWASYPQTFIT